MRAAEINHLSVLQWAYANGSPFDMESYIDGIDRPIFVSGIRGKGYDSYINLLRWNEEYNLEKLERPKEIENYLCRDVSDD